MSKSKYQVSLTDDGELVEAVEVTESPDIDDSYKPKEKRTRVQRYLYSGVGTGVGLGIVALIVIGIVLLVQHIQHQIVVSEWKLPEFTSIQCTPPVSNGLTAPDLFSAAFQCMESVTGLFMPCIVMFLVSGIALRITKFFKDSLR